MAATVLIEASVKHNGNTYQSIQQVYIFDFVEDANRFAEKFDNLQQNSGADNTLRALVQDDVFDCLHRDEPLLLHVLHAPKNTTGRKAEPYYAVEPLTKDEIEFFRKFRLFPIVVKAYDDMIAGNPEAGLKPVTLTGNERANELKLLSVYDEDDIRDMDIYVTFDANCADTVCTNKFGSGSAV